MIRCICILLALSVTSVMQAQSFEGYVEFTKKEGSILSFYKYFVKGPNIRVEELNEHGQIQGVLLVDVSTETQTALNPKRMMYMDIPAKRGLDSAIVEVVKTEKQEVILDEKCTLWKTTNKEEDRIIEYWVTEGPYDFFIPMLRTIKRKDNQAVYFLAIEDAAGVFPMRGTETKEDGTFISELEVKEIKVATIGEDLFVIPKDYQPFK